MSPEDYRLLVYVAAEEVRNIPITGIVTADVVAPDPARPTLHRVVIMTKGRAESEFFFRDLDKAQLFVTNVLEGRDAVQQVRLSLSPDINQHLLHPDDRS